MQAGLTFTRSRQQSMKQERSKQRCNLPRRRTHPSSPPPPPRAGAQQDTAQQVNHQCTPLPAYAPAPGRFSTQGLVRRQHHILCLINRVFLLKSPQLRYPLLRLSSCPGAGALVRRPGRRQAGRAGGAGQRCQARRRSLRSFPGPLSGSSARPTSTAKRSPCLPIIVRTTSFRKRPPLLRLMQPPAHSSAACRPAGHRRSASMTTSSW